MSFEVTPLTAHERCERAWAKLEEVMKLEDTKAIQAAFDEAYAADQKEAEASVRIRRQGSRSDPVTTSPTFKEGRAGADNEAQPAGGAGTHRRVS